MMKRGGYIELNGVVFLFFFAEEERNIHRRGKEDIAMS